MHFGSVKPSQIKVACTPSPKDKTDLSLIVHTIEQAEPVYILGRCVSLSLATFSDARFVQLPIIAPDVLDHVPCSIGDGQRMFTDTACIDHMRLFKSFLDAGLFGHISIGQMDVLKLLFDLFVHPPAYHSHVSSTPEMVGALLNFVFLMGSMDEIMTGAT